MKGQGTIYRPQERNVSPRVMRLFDDAFGTNNNNVADWAERRFYIPSLSVPGNPKTIKIYPHQRAILNLAFTRNKAGDLPYRTFVYSTIKQSGKSTISGVVGRWYAETQRRFSELYFIGNDQDQAKGRGFREILWSVQLDPAFDSRRERIPGEWQLQKTQMTCIRTGTTIRALPVDAKGEAGGKPALQIWTEIWGIENEDGRRFWDELTPIPTIPDSVRIVETYAGYLNESELLYSVYEEGTKNGRQLTAGELASRTHTPLDAFKEAISSESGLPDPETLVPVYENRASSMLMYWDTGDEARRMPWQLGERGNEYYVEQERNLVPNAFNRLHRNLWSSAEAAFVQEAHWDACFDPELAITEGGKFVRPKMLEPGDRTPIVLGVDAATTGDCFAIVAVTRHPVLHDEIAVRAVKVFDPKETGGIVSYEAAENFIRYVCQGGCYGDARGDVHALSLPDENCDSCKAIKAGAQAVPGYNVVQIAYDPYQLEQMMQRLRKDNVTWCKAFSQAQDRLKADRGLYDMILTRRLHHNGDLRLKSHILNAGAKLQKDQDSTLRLVKVRQTGKIDAAVALSMAGAACLYLLL